MSFLWGKGKKNPPPSGLPPAARDISSSHGPDTRIPSANGGGIAGGIAGSLAGPREGVERRGTVGSTQAPTAAVTAAPNTALVQKINGEPPQRLTRERSESDFGVSIKLFWCWISSRF
jgi:hypothetical protein